MTSVEVTTWFLQMTDPAQLAPAPDADPALEVRQAELPSPELSRALYAGVGSDWYWIDRLGWTWSRWHEHLARAELETWVAWLRGTPAGFAELEHDGDAVELVSFGLLPAFIGRGLGPQVLDAVLRRAWALEPRRVWVHTCSLDGPAALRTYQRRGFDRLRRAHAPDDPAGRAAGAVAGSGAPDRLMRWLVDASNVIGSKPDGWWRDREGAARRLIEALRRFAEEEGEDVTVVLDAGPPEWAGREGSLEVAIAPRRGRDAADDEIARLLDADPDAASIRS